LKAIFCVGRGLPAVQLGRVALAMERSDATFRAEPDAGVADAADTSAAGLIGDVLLVPAAPSDQEEGVGSGKEESGDEAHGNNHCITVAVVSGAELRVQDGLLPAALLFLEEPASAATSSPFSVRGRWMLMIFPFVKSDLGLGVRLGAARVGYTVLSFSPRRIGSPRRIAVEAGAGTAEYFNRGAAVGDGVPRPVPTAVLIESDLKLAITVNVCSSNFEASRLTGRGEG
jgi:hypothetical protein